MPQVQTTLTGHSSDSGPKPPKTGRPWTRHDFTAADGAKYSTFDTALGNKAYGLLNQPVTVIFEQEQRGEFVNNTLKSVDAVAGGSAVGSSAPGLATGGGVQAAQQGSPPPAAVAGVVTGPPLVLASAVAPTQTQDDRQVAIMRQSAVERAIRYFAFVGAKPTSTDQIYELADEFVSYFVNGRCVDESLSKSVPLGPSLDDVGF